LNRSGETDAASMFVGRYPSLTLLLITDSSTLYHHRHPVGVVCSWSDGAIAVVHTAITAAPSTIPTRFVNDDIAWLLFS
jgi:hypothetical protein